MVGGLETVEIAIIIAACDSQKFSTDPAAAPQQQPQQQQQQLYQPLSWTMVAALRSTATMSSTIPTEIHGTDSTTTTTAKLAPNSPHRKTSSPIKATPTPRSPNRARVNSRDIPRSYSGLYGEENDLLPFELNRTQHTDWLESKVVLITYVVGILVFQVVVTALLDSTTTGDIGSNKRYYKWSWTITNATHCLLSTIYLHWLKGSIFDNQGEMAALTLWEQLEGRRKTQTVKRILTLVPTLICYAACHFCGYHGHICLVNIAIWIIHVLGKLPIMNGVRIFGINRTTGIDDDTKED